MTLINFTDKFSFEYEGKKYFLEKIQEGYVVTLTKNNKKYYSKIIDEGLVSDLVSIYEGYEGENKRFVNDFIKYLANSCILEIEAQVRRGEKRN